MASGRGRLRCREQNIQNAEVITADMNYYDPGKSFDRIRSVEMFMHMRNYKQLLRKIASWIKPDGGLFVHREYAYLFETEGEYNWMGAAGTSFWIDSKEQMIGVFMIQNFGDNYRKAQQFKQLAYQAIVD